MVIVAATEIQLATIAVELPSLKALSTRMAGESSAASNGYHRRGGDYKISTLDSHRKRRYTGYREGALKGSRGSTKRFEHNGGIAESQEQLFTQAGRTSASIKSDNGIIVTREVAVETVCRFFNPTEATTLTHLTSPLAGKLSTASSTSQDLPLAMTGLSRRSSRAHSIISDDTVLTPRPTPAPPPTRRSGTRGVRTVSPTADAAQSTTAHPSRLPPHYFLAPTVPSPFASTLEASLDAILHWGTLHAATTRVRDELLRPVSTSTNWPALLGSTLGAPSTLDGETSRFLLEEFLFLVTRTLFPEQIAQNRGAMGRLYERKKHLAIRLVLRYDMLREWCVGDGPVSKRDVSVASVPPATATLCGGVGSAAPTDSPMEDSWARGEAKEYKRRPLMLNVWPTLITAPEGGYSTQGVRERMKHYVTPLDEYLLLSDEEVREWSEKWLVVRASQIALQWQWLRKKNETLEDMEAGGWEELDGRAEECEWIAEKRDGPIPKVGKGVEEGA
ncbi:hypothetical protein SVAN01_10602 [Stagonosporopsis vannaccii]|nr:hypothetical protein SVAN01_10602 [Stagonosporopsis vannaccii]